ncbi:MAG TPA: hypothetical protein VHL30_02705 [Chlamydiales bacterium]|jgi:predicted membrane protein|nr:hypothetical protein [Chlamydiales bacterium]
MAHPLTSRKKAQSFYTALFLLGIAILIYTDAWWPGIMLVIGIPLALRQYLLGRRYDMMISLLVFVGTFVTVQYDISWRIFLPVLFTLGAIYVLVRELSESSTQAEAEDEEDLNHEIEEKKK